MNILKKALKNQKIVSARYLTKEELESLNVETSNVCLTMENGNKIIPIDSHAFNETGVLFTSDEKESIFPTIFGKMLDNEKEMNYWNEKVKNFYEGKTIKSIRTLNKKEKDDLNWYSDSIVLFFDDDSYTFVSKDDEGNDGGVFYLHF